jgi:hypothetical protein
MVTMLAGAHGRSGHYGGVNILLPLSAVQIIARRCTDWAMEAEVLNDITDVSVQLTTSIFRVDDYEY